MTYWLFLLFSPSVGLANLKYLKIPYLWTFVCSLLLLVGSAYQQITEFTYSNLYLCKQCGKMTFDISIIVCFLRGPTRKFFNVIKIIFCEISIIWSDAIHYSHASCIVEDLCMCVWSVCMVTMIKGDLEM